jgi:hypothetical protein
VGRRGTTAATTRRHTEGGPTMSPILKSSLFIVVLVAGLVAPARQAGALVTYVGTFALTNGACVKCLTGEIISMHGDNILVRAPWAAATTQQWAFFLLPNGFYAIMNVESTLFLYAPKDPFGGNVIFQTKWTADLGQQWYLFPLGNHFYALVNVATGKMLTDPNLNSQNSTPVTQTEWADTLNQWWYLYFLRL